MIFDDKIFQFLIHITLMIINQDEKNGNANDDGYV